MSPSSPKPVRETVVLLHSSASSARQWDALAAVLSDQYAVHAVDLHGHGRRSAWPGPAPLTLADEARLAAPLLAAAGSAHVIGHSYGGAVALKLASLQPERVRSVVVYEPTLFRILVEEGAWGLPARDIRFTADAIRAFVRAGRPAEAARHFVDFWSRRGQYDRMSASRQRGIDERMATVLAHFDALFAEPLTSAALRRLTMPRLFLTGADTVATTRHLGELLRLGVPGAVHETLAGLGHMGPITDADIVNRRIAAFLDSGPSAGAAPAGGEEEFARASFSGRQRDPAMFDALC